MSVTQTLASTPRLRTLGMSAEIAARLRTMIEEGELPPGARVDERAFCELFDVSKTPLREALKVLVAEGLVLHRQYIGYRVAPLDSTNCAPPSRPCTGWRRWPASWRPRGCPRPRWPSWSGATGPCSKPRRRAAHRILPHQPGDPPVIIDGAANPVLAGIYAALMSKVHRARGAANADTLRWQESHEEHEAIMAAARARRPRLAAVLRHHSENTAEKC